MEIAISDTKVSPNVQLSSFSAERIKKINSPRSERERSKIDSKFNVESFIRR